jgi:hypothetical protein
MPTEEVRKLIQALRNIQITGNGSAGAGERIISGNLNMPISENTSFDVGLSSVKVPGFNKNMLTNVGVKHRTNNGMNIGVNANLEPNEYGSNRGLMATFGVPF